MQKKIITLAMSAGLAGAMMVGGAGTASAAHYCVVTPSGVHQTNGNGARGGSDGWRNSSSGIENAERAGALVDCGELGVGLPMSNRR